jgi:tetratricopeptide (TPR) repeat protein
MNYEERKKKAFKLIEEDNYRKAFDEFASLFYENPKDLELIKVCFFLLDRMIEGNYDFQPETAEQFIFRGVSKFYKSEYLNSIEDYDKAIAINPKLDYAIKCKAFSLTFLSKYEQAIECLEKAIQINPAGEYYDDIAENYSKLGDHKSASIYHEKAIQFSPNDFRLWYNYGTHLGAHGDFERAIKMFDESIRLYPLYEDAIHNREYYLKRLKEG